MKYEKINKENLYNEIYKVIKNEYPQQKEEFYQLMTLHKTQQAIRFQLKRSMIQDIQKIFGYSYNSANCKASQLIDDLPEELFPNIEEWLSNEPISEIDYGGISIKKIMEQHKKSFGVMYDFLTCLSIMNDYIRTGCKDKSICYIPFLRADLY